MSRTHCSYDEEWQRKKSLTNRSLFHDITILSPLEEEFDSSTQADYAPTDEVFPSPPRPYSPLPPLIIERVPIINKHDEPEEYYQKLHKKMKRLYEKLFIENRNVNSVDYDSSDDDGLVSNDHITIHDNSDTTENLDIPFHQSISPENENLNSIVEDRDDSQSSAATESNGYIADCDSMDTASIDVINYSRSNEDAIMISEEEKLASEKLNEKKISNDDNVIKWISEQNKFTTERIEDLVSAEERSVGNYTIYDQEMIESGESLHEMEVEHSYEITGPNYKRIDESMKQAHHTSIREQKSTHIENFNESENEKQTEDITETDSDSYDSGSESKETQKIVSGRRKEIIEPNYEPFEGEMELEPSSTSEDPDYRQVTVKAMVHIDGSQGNEDRESIVSEESVRSIILPTRFKMVPSRKVDERIGGLAALEEKEDPDYRQVKVKAMVHIDGSQGDEDRESIVSEESVRSIILPTRFKMVPSRKVDERIGGLAALEEKEDPDYRQVTVKAMVHIDGSQGNEDRESIVSEESVRSIILPTRSKMVPSRKVDERIGGLAALEEKEDPDYRQVTVKAMVHIDGSQGDEDRESIVSEESVRSIILPTRFKMVPSRKVDERIGGLAALEEKEDPDYRQVTVKAMVHIDGSQGNEDRESIVSEESVRSIILPTRSKMVPSRKVDERIGGLAALEEKEDPNTAPIFDSDQEETTDEDLEEETTPIPDAIEQGDEESSTSQIAISEETRGTARAEQEMDDSEKAVDERSHQTDFTDMESPHPIEVMRTPRPDLSHRISIRHESSSRSTGELAAVPRHATAIMSSSQGEVGSNVSENQTSIDMNENQNSIFKESKTEASGRKRKLIDKSVQTVPTSMVSWDEMRSNFFVGTPKIFRLCACTDHICN